MVESDHQGEKITMNWDAIGAIGEIVGALAVVITLIYLAAQMKMNTTAVNRSASQAVLSGRGEAARFLANDADISDIFWKAGSDPDSLTEREWQRFILIANAAIRPIELAYLDRIAGRLSDEMWEGQENTIAYWFSQPGFQRWLTEYGHTLNPKCRAYIEEVATKSKN